MRFMAAARFGSTPPSLGGSGHFTIHRPRWNVAIGLCHRVGVPLLADGSHAEQEDAAQAGQRAERAADQQDFPPHRSGHQFVKQEAAGNGEQEDEGEEGGHAALGSRSAMSKGTPCSSAAA